MTIGYVFQHGGIIADTVIALKKAHADLRVVSVGVGVYPEPKSFIMGLVKKLLSVQLLQKTLEVNTKSMDQLRTVLFKDSQTIRISDTFETPDMATNLFEDDLDKLDILHQRGRDSFARLEAQLKKFLL